MKPLTHWRTNMSDEKPVEYYVEFSIRIKERGGAANNAYAQEVFNQRISWDYFQDNPLMIPQVIAVINKLGVPNV